MRKLLPLFLLFPVAAFAQYDYSASHTNDYTVPVVLACYGIVCFGVAVICSNRGWDGLGVFVAAVLLTPIVAAILYSPYKKEIPAIDHAVPEKTSEPSAELP